jgi:hypothetical protein
VIGTHIKAKQAKDDSPYSFVLNQDHLDVLRALTHAVEMTDAQLTFTLRRHMIAPRRCELRDAGFVAQAGRAGRSKTWRITNEGIDALAQSNAALAAA